uniref:Uncharacterized protein n=1 Tax=Panagrolaimus superbus TaxID=310955 RepID=A0A914Y2Z9_9BILA
MHSRRAYQSGSCRHWLLGSYTPSVQLPPGAVADDSVAGPEGTGGRERRNECGPAADAAGACRCDRGRARSERVRGPAAAGKERPGRGPAGLPAGPQRDQ